QPAAVSPEKVDAQVSGSKGSSSVEVGAVSAKQKNVEVAIRFIKKSALPGCDAEQDFDKSVSNGELPEEWLCNLGIEDHQLRADAAVSFAKMNAAYKKDTGKELEITDSYRDMSGQLSVAGRKPGLAAKPGTSLHGWGSAFAGGRAAEAGSDAQSPAVAAPVDHLRQPDEGFAEAPDARSCARDRAQNEEDPVVGGADEDERLLTRDRVPRLRAVGEPAPPRRLEHVD